MYFLLLAIRGTTFKFVLLLADVESAVQPYRIVDGEACDFTVFERASAKDECILTKAEGADLTIEIVWTDTVG